jgi:hypothetical protein
VGARIVGRERLEPLRELEVHEHEPPLCLRVILNTVHRAVEEVAPVFVFKRPLVEVVPVACAIGCPVQAEVAPCVLDERVEGEFFGEARKADSARLPEFSPDRYDGDGPASTKALVVMVCVPLGQVPVDCGVGQELAVLGFLERMKALVDVDDRGILKRRPLSVREDFAIGPSVRRSNKSRSVTSSRPTHSVRPGGAAARSARKAASRVRRLRACDVVIVNEPLGRAFGADLRNLCPAAALA